MSNSQEPIDASSDELEAGLSLSTGLVHTVRAHRYRLHVRLPIDPSQARSHDDRFILRTQANGADLQQKKSTHDDLIPGDDFVDLIFDGLEPDQHYTLEIDPGTEGVPYTLFEDAPFSDLFNV